MENIKMLTEEDHKREHYINSGKKMTRVELELAYKKECRKNDTEIGWDDFINRYCEDFLKNGGILVM